MIASCQYLVLPYYLVMTAKELRKNLSTNIKKYRNIYSLTQEKLAEKTGLSAQTINDIEGMRTWVSDKSLTKIAEALHVTPADLLLSDKRDENDFVDKNSKLIALQTDINRYIEAAFSKFFDN
jgi:transcriptional regulator with XRE-family HTH domain